MLAVGGARGGAVGAGEDGEDDAHRVQKREEMVARFKNSLGYSEYLRHVPREKRTRNDPQTPDASQKMSKRQWTSRLSGWRRRLLSFAPPQTLRVVRRLDELDDDDRRLVRAAEALGCYHVIRMVVVRRRDPLDTVTLGLYRDARPDRVGTRLRTVVSGEADHEALWADPGASERLQSRRGRVSLKAGAGRDAGSVGPAVDRALADELARDPRLR